MFSRLLAVLFCFLFILQSAPLMANRATVSEKTIPERAVQGIHDYFMQNPPGALVASMVESLANREPSIYNFHTFNRLMQPAILLVSKRVSAQLDKDIEKLSHKLEKHYDASLEEKINDLKEEKVVEQEFIDLIEDGLNPSQYSREEFQQFLDDLKVFVESGNLKDLRARWAKNTRIAGFSSSLSVHTTSGGIDINAFAKIAPQGPILLYGQNDKYEMNRHTPALNKLLKQVNWGNLAGTAGQVPLHYGWEELQHWNVTGAFSNIIEHSDEMGVVKIIDDAENELLEVTRSVFWVVTLLHHQEIGLARYAIANMATEIGGSMRRLRKFIQLHDYGNHYFYTANNIAALTGDVLDPFGAYWETLQQMIDSLWEKEPYSGAFYAEAISVGLKFFEPSLAALHFYLYGVGTRIDPEKRGGAAHQIYNLVQYITYALPQTYLHLEAVADSISDGLGVEEPTYRQAIKGSALIGGGSALLALYGGTFGPRPREIINHNLGGAVRIMLVDAIGSTIISAATGKHISLFSLIHSAVGVAASACRSGYYSVTGYFGYKTDSGAKEEL